MVEFLQGPGRDIKFCSITSGIDMDPNHGGIARAYYDWFKNVLIEKAETHYEHDIVRESEIDVSSFLKGYSNNQRLVWQFLYGTVEHSDPWTIKSLTEAVDTAPLPRKLRPTGGEYSIDFYASKDAGMKLFENRTVMLSDVWVEKLEFYYSNIKPWLNDGESGDVWFVSDGTDVEIWHKPAFKWFRIDDYAATQTPVGTITYSTADPGNTTNSWWFDYTGLVIRKYDEQLNIWEPATTTVVSTTAPTGLNDGDLWVRIVNGKFSLSVWDAGINSFKKAIFSPLPVQDRATNSTFVGTPGNNNFIITCGDAALAGLPITGVADLEVRKDGVLVATAVDCLNFKGPDIDVSSLSGCVDIEHLPVTTLPEQTGDPLPTTDAGKIYTLDVGGVSELFYIDDAGNVVQLTNQGSLSQNIFLTVVTFSAVSGQTMFTIPPSAKDVLTLKINGLDSDGWSFISPSVMYNPTSGGYIVESGDEVSVIYYG